MQYMVIMKQHFILKMEKYIMGNFLRMVKY